MTLIQISQKLQFRDWLGLWSHVRVHVGGYYFRLTWHCGCQQGFNSPCCWAEGLIFLVHVCWWPLRCLPGAPLQGNLTTYVLDLPQSERAQPKMTHCQKGHLLLCYIFFLKSWALVTAHTKWEGCKRLRKLEGEKQEATSKAALKKM